MSIIIFIEARYWFRITNEYNNILDVTVNVERDAVYEWNSPGILRANQG